MRKYVLAAFLGATLMSVCSPVPAGADTSLGGFEASAVAMVVRVTLYEPALPIPTEPQGDVGVAYARAQSSTGPSSRALASYLWPGDVVGDGLGVLTGSEDVDYPVKVNSKFPATDGAPAKNTAQLTDGNGMTTSADESTTRSVVTGAGIMGGNVVSGIGEGLCQLLKQSCPAAPETPSPVEVTDALAAAATMQHVVSQSTVKLGEHGIRSVAHAKASEVSLLAGLITIDSIDLAASATSNGKKATTTGESRISGLKIGGQAIDLGETINLGGQSTKLPEIPLDLSAIGVKIEYLQTQKTADEASGSLGAQGLTITVDASVLSRALSLGTVSDALAPILGEIPNAGPLLAGLLRLGSKIVITVGDVSASATATPQFVAPPPEDNGPGGDGSGPGGNGAGPGGAGDGGLGNVDAGPLPTAVDNIPDVTGTGPTTTDPRPASFQLPGLGQVPSLLILGALAVAGAFGWVFQTVGRFVFGSANCPIGLTTGVPDLRKV